MAQLTGKIALVTGSAHGIGKAIAIGLAREGANMALADKDTEALRIVQKSIIDMGVEAEAVPTCPECGKPMRRRKAKSGPNAGQSFWGCTAYPACKGTRKVESCVPSPESKTGRKHDE